MTDKVAHRGPDDSGLYVEGNVGLGHRRLSILDLSKHGHQPMSNSDGTIWIAYNGECYNYREFYPELRARGCEFRSTSDTEVLLYLYQEYGLSFLDRVAGMFALAIWDGRTRRLVLARDRLGIKPLFYYHDREHLVFGSELKALLIDPGLPREIDYNAVEAFFALAAFRSLFDIPQRQAAPARPHADFGRRFGTAAALLGNADAGWRSPAQPEERGHGLPRALRRHRQGSPDLGRAGRSVPERGCQFKLDRGHGQPPC